MKQENFTRIMLRLRVNDKWGVVNNKYQEIIPVKYDSIATYSIFSLSLAEDLFFFNSKLEYMLQERYELLVSSGLCDIFSHWENFHFNFNNMFLCLKSSNWNIINSNEEILDKLNSEYDCMHIFS